MAPRLRPRPVAPQQTAPQQTAPLTRTRRVSTVKQPQGQSKSSKAADSTRSRTQKGTDPQDRSHRPDTSAERRPLEPVKNVEDSRSKSSEAPATEQVSTLSKAQQATERSETSRPGLKLSQAQPVALHRESNARLRKSAYIASWSREVYQKVRSEVVDEPKINRLLTLDQYVSSTPWYRSYGYDTSDEEMAPASVGASGAISKNKEAKPSPPRCFDLTNAKAVTVLSDRNVEFDRRDEEDQKWINIVMAPEPSSTCSVQDEERWNLDFAKCKVSDEAIFQRTIMMELIDRHHLAEILDYTCESPWTCTSTMPQRQSDLANLMPKPRPDLAVAFKTKSLLSVFQQTDFRSWRSIMCPESATEAGRARAFHFLSIEAKGASGQLVNWVADRQNFNTASQALHNIYFFMNEAGQDMLDAFYKSVRFYSVVATSGIFYVRVHRAIKLKKGRIRGDYPLGFVYDMVYHHEGGGYTRAKAMGIIRNILVEYGVKVLHPLLVRIMEKIWDKLDTLQLSANRNGLLDEAEEYRSRGRAASRRTRDQSAISYSSHKATSV